MHRLNKPIKSSTFLEFRPSTDALVQRTNKKVLVLDLDETLVHCRMEKFETATCVTSIKAEGCYLTIHIAKRPGLKAFLKKMSEYYQIILYTSSIKEYAYAVLNALRIKKYFAAIFHRGHCVQSYGKKIEKRLSILARSPSDVVLIDDSSLHIKNQPDNILVIKQFRGESNDSELYELTSFLRGLARCPDVRPVAKKFADYLQHSANQKQGTSIATKGLGNKTFETKFIQLLNDQYKPRIRTPRKSYDQASFENTEEDQNNNSLSPKIAAMNLSKQLFFEMIKSGSPENIEYENDFETNQRFTFGMRSYSQPHIIFKGDLQFETEKLAEAELHLAQEFDEQLVESLPQMAVNSQFLKLRELEKPTSPTYSL